jgi:hypothetical protein
MSCPKGTKLHQFPVLAQYEFTLCRATWRQSPMRRLCCLEIRQILLLIFAVVQSRSAWRVEIVSQEQPLF